MSTVPICPVCNKNPCLLTKSRGYVEWCSPTCRSRHPAVETKRKETCIKKYGDITSARHPLVKQKKAETCVSRYGSVSPSLNTEVRKKQKTTMKKKYGVENAYQSQEIKQKITNTLKQKYGVETLTEVKKLPKIFDKNKKTRIQNWLPKKWEQFDQIAKPLYSVEQYQNNKQPLPYRCCKCQSVFYDNIINGSIPRCPECFPLRQTNWQQEELVDFVKSLGVEVITNCRTIIPPQELDIFIPSHNIAIEYDGLYWHSEAGSEGRVNKNYHLNKTNHCLEKGIQLIHIFGDEWNNNQQVVKSMIQSKLNLSPIKIHARKCEIQEVSSKQATKFLKENHIQGSDKSPVRLGLFFENELVCLMTFSRPRFIKDIQYELVRFCCKQNVNVVGGASKLLSYFEKAFTPSSIITYADKRYSTGKLYEKLGFKNIRETPPSYFYVHIPSACKVRYNRLNFQKHKLQNMLSAFDTNLTESENMKNNQYSKIWDCGNYVFIKDFS